MNMRINEFFISCPAGDRLQDLKIHNPLSDNNSSNLGENCVHLFLGNESKVITGKKWLYVSVGDVIKDLPDNGSNPLSLNTCYSLSNILLEYPGHYYLFHYSKELNIFQFSSSMFSMLPIYWYQYDNQFLAASRVSLIQRFLDKEPGINKQFVLEQFLFNYPLFEQSILNDVKLCPANTVITLKDGKVKFEKHTEITDYYNQNPLPWKKSADNLVDLFIDRSSHYMPDEKFQISFTGGFDGRSLVACAKHLNKSFDTFSFGTHLNNDVSIPQKNSHELGITFKPFYLDNNSYIKEHFLKDGKELIELTSGLSNYLYVHFLYSAKLLSNQSNYLFTGYFGSELFRALHLTGAMSSEELVTYFQKDDEDKWIDKIQNSWKLKYLKANEFSEELDVIIEKLRKYKMENKKKLLTKNQFYYTYVFEEIFRKVFGSHITAQSKYLKVRTPYLDFKFIAELLKTELAGVNNPFFVQNPVKRFKGQYFYGKLISKAYHELAKVKTQKGYRPIDLVSASGKIKILFPYIKKRFKKRFKAPYLDNLSIISGLREIRSIKSDFSMLEEYYNTEMINFLKTNLDGISENKRDLIALSMSTSTYEVELKPGVDDE